MENNVENKSNKGIIIALSIVIVVLIGTIAFMFINNNSTKNLNNNKTEETEKENEQDEEMESEENKEQDVEKEETEDNEEEDATTEETQNKKENLDLTSDLVTKLYGYTKNGEESIKEYFISNISFNNKTISDEMKLKIAFYAIGEEKFENSCSEELCTADKVIDAKVVLNKINKIFGENNGYKHVTNWIDVFTTDACRKLNYNKELEQYILYVDGGCGGFTTYAIFNKLIGAEKYNDSIVLTEKIYVAVAGPEGNVYKDLKTTKLIASGVTNFIDNQEMFDKGATVTYTFKLAKDGSYYFDNSKISY